MLSAALLAAGCGGGSPGETVANVGSTTPDTGAAPSPGGASASQGDSSDRAQKYSQCMRDHGVTDFPDPVDGKIQLRITPDSTIKPDSPQFKAAVKACRSLAPSGPKVGAAQSEELQQRMLEFAQCMRDHGLSNFPDPQVSGGRVKMMLPRGGGINPQSEQFQSAQQACRSKLPSRGPGAPPAP